MAISDPSERVGHAQAAGGERGEKARDEAHGQGQREPESDRLPREMEEGQEPPPVGSPRRVRSLANPRPAPPPTAATTIVSAITMASTKPSATPLAFRTASS